MNSKLFIKEKLLCQTDKYFFCYNKGYIVLRDRNKKIIQKFRIHSFVKSVRIIERVFRYEPRAAIAMSDDSFIFADHGVILSYNVENNNISKEHHFSKGMNSPLSFCARYGTDGKITDLLYGEYIWNIDKGPVSVYRRNRGVWNKIYSFPKNSITHIHNIVYDKYKDRYIIMTGDDDKGSGIWQSDVDFNNVTPIVLGSQKYRACIAYPSDNGIYYATDTPLEQDKLFRLNENNDGSISLNEIYDMPGPCIYGIVHNDDLYMATSVEGDPNQSTMKYRLSNKLGDGVKDRFVHVIKCSPNGSVNEIEFFRKDILPMWLFQFGNVHFPTQCDRDRLYMCPQSVNEKHGTYIFKV